MHRPAEDTNKILIGKGIQLSLPLDHAPPKVRAHGLRDAHSHPLVSRGKDVAGNVVSFRTTPDVAWTFPSLEYARSGNSYACLVFDCDGWSGTMAAWEAIFAEAVPDPNWVVTRKSSGGSHVVYTLENPVHRGESARSAPLRMLARVSEFFAAELGADPGYTGVLAHNPMSKGHGPGFGTTWRRREPYSVQNDLLPFVPKHWRRPTCPATAVGRNCQLFEAMSRWAGSPANLGCEVLPVALAANREWNADHPSGPLPDSEVAGIARSVEKKRRQWEAQGRFYTEAERSEYGRRRGIASGEARRSRTQERDSRIVADYLAGRGTHRDLADRYGLGRTTISHIIKRDSPQLQDDLPGIPSGSLP